VTFSVDAITSQHHGRSCQGSRLPFSYPQYNQRSSSTQIRDLGSKLRFITNVRKCRSV
jgi:hypothetical protein